MSSTTTEPDTEVLRTHTSVNTAIEEELREVTRVMTKACIESAARLDLGSGTVTRLQVHGLVQNVTKNLRWVDDDHDF